MSARLYVMDVQKRRVIATVLNESIEGDWIDITYTTVSIDTLRTTCIKFLTTIKVVEDIGIVLERDVLLCLYIDDSDKYHFDTMLCSIDRVHTKEIQVEHIVQRCRDNITVLRSSFEFIKDHIL